MNVIDRIFEVNSKKGAPGLSRIRRLLMLMGNPEEKFRIIHVAGTNGKGSTSHYLRSILVQAGYKTGMFTSPHINTYNERIQVNYDNISDADFERIADYVMSFKEQLAEEGYGYPSLFEILNVMAYQYFAEQNIDYMISEVGIGGRNDCTNAIPAPVVTLITQIGLDHTEILGDTIEEVACQKAGIIKSNVPVITSSWESEVEAVIREEAEEKNAPFASVNDCRYTISDKYELSDEGCTQSFDLACDGIEYKNIRISMLGEHQVRNAIAAILAIRASGIAVTEDELRAGLVKAVNPGRFEVLGTKPYFVIDGAHNMNGLKASIEAFNNVFGNANNKKTLVLFGCFKDKDFRGMIDTLGTEFSSCSFIATMPEGGRALNSDMIKSILESEGLECRNIPEPSEAYKAAIDGDYDIIYVLGSIYLISEIRNMKRKEL